MQLNWTPVRSARDNPEAVVKCAKCGKTNLVHPNYTNSGISACQGNSRCDDLKSIAQAMVQLRGWRFEKIGREEGKNHSYVHFTRPNGTHTCIIKYETLRLGGDCNSCKVKISKRVDCDCPGSRPTSRPLVCKHHNHLTRFPLSASEWDYEKNHPVRPEELTPTAKKTFWWKCSADHCKMSYEQPCAYRADGNGCPYCSGRKACHWNCFETLHPELLHEWSPENELNPSEILENSHSIIKWICSKCDRRYSATPHSRVTQKSGCIKCNRNGYDQMVGGYDHFVAEARRVHGDTYQYPGNYRGNNTKMEMLCGKLSSNGETHGSFWQDPHNHKSGAGCPKCASEESVSRGMKMIEEALNMLGYVKGSTYIREHTFEDLKAARKLFLDVWLPELSLVIEFDGEQHFRMPDHWGGEESLIETKYRDKIKDSYCVTNKKNLLRIPYNITPLTVSSLKELISMVEEQCRSGRHVYFSYREYIDHVAETQDLSEIFVIAHDDP